MSTCSRVSVALLLVSALTACANPGPSPPSADTPTDLRLEEVSSFGCDACGGLEQIQAFWVALTADGHVLLVDGYEPFVRVFETDGTPLTGFGVKGQGPDGVGSGNGRYFPPQAAFPGPAGSVLVFDGMPTRVKRFSREGGLQANVSLPQRVVSNLTFDFERQRLWTASYSPLDGMAPRIDRYDDLAGPVAEPAVILRDPEIFPMDADGEDRSAYFAFAATADGGFAVGDSRQYVIRVFDEDGLEVERFGRDIPRPRRTDEEMERIRQQNEQMKARLGRVMPEPEVELVHFTFFAFAYDDSGRLWVLTTRGRDERAVFDVFDGDGSFLQEVEVDGRLSGGFNDYAIGGNLLVGIVKGELDNTTIKVWRIVDS